MNWRVFRILGTIIVVTLSSLAITGPASAGQNTPVLSDKFPEEIARDKWAEETFDNLKAIHIFVCEIVDQSTIPQWLTRDALVKDAREYIAGGHHGIMFADSKAHEPDVRKCIYDPVLDEPGNLNFIIKVSVYPANFHSSETYPLATVERFIYRPDHRTSIYAFLRNGPFLLDLSDKKAQSDFELDKNAWMTGFSNEPAHNK